MPQCESCHCDIPRGKPFYRVEKGMMALRINAFLEETRWDYCPDCWDSGEYIVHEEP